MRTTLAVATITTLALACVATPAQAETRTWTRAEGVVERMSAGFGDDTLTLRTLVRKRTKDRFAYAGWYLRTAPGGGYSDFLVWYDSRRDEATITTADGDEPSCADLDVERSQRRRALRVEVPVGCLADADGATPDWVRLRHIATIQGRRDGRRFCETANVPDGRGFTAKVFRGETGDRVLAGRSGSAERAGVRRGC